MVYGKDLYFRPTIFYSLYKRFSNFAPILLAVCYLLMILSGESKYHFYVTNRFHVAVRLFSNRSQMTSKFGKNKKVAHEA